MLVPFTLHREEPNKTLLMTLIGVTVTCTVAKLEHLTMGLIGELMFTS